MARISGADDAFSFKMPMFDFAGSIRAAAIPDFTGILATARPTIDFTDAMRSAAMPAIGISESIRAAAIPDLTGILATARPTIDFTDAMRSAVMPAINISDAVFAATRPAFGFSEAVRVATIPPIDISESIRVAAMPDLSKILGFAALPTFNISDVLGTATVPTINIADAIRTVRIAEAALRAAGEGAPGGVEELDTYDLAQLLRQTSRISIQTVVAIVVYCAAISYVLDNYESASVASTVFGPNPLVVAMWAWAVTGWLLKQLNSGD